MRYENIKTGAVIDSPFPVKGNLWVAVDNKNQDITELSEHELRNQVLDQQNKIDDLEATIEKLEKSLELHSEKDLETEYLDVIDEDEADEIDLETLTKAELEELAKEQDIKLTTNNKKNKESLIAAIVEALG